MSFLKTQATGLVGTLVGKFLAVSPTRSFAGFKEFCSITEAHEASVQATQYPIEDGTHGTDHIIKLPDAITWEIAFDDRSNPRETYERLRDLMFSGEPFDAETGLKTYHDMVLLSVSAAQDHHTGRILRCTVTLQQIIITAAVSTTLPPRAKQSNAQVTGSTSKTGSKNLSKTSPARAEQHSLLSAQANDVKRSVNAFGF